MIILFNIRNLRALYKVGTRLWNSSLTLYHNLCNYLIRMFQKNEFNILSVIDNNLSDE